MVSLLMNIISAYSICTANARNVCADTLYRVQCRPYIVCDVVCLRIYWRVHCTLYGVYTVHSMPYSLYGMYIIWIVHCTMYSVQFIWCTCHIMKMPYYVQCTWHAMYSVHSMAYSLYGVYIICKAYGVCVIWSVHHVT